MLIIGIFIGIALFGSVLIGVGIWESRRKFIPSVEMFMIVCPYCFDMFDYPEDADKHCVGNPPKCVSK